MSTPPSPQADPRTVSTVLPYIPNAITIGRILLAPLFVITFLWASPSASFSLPAVVLGLAGLSDYVDGRLARRWGAESALGAVLDPFADKLIIGCAVVVLFLDGRLPLLALLLLGGRLVLLWLPRVFMLRRRDLVGVILRFRASWLGRLSATILYFALGFVTITPSGTIWPLVLFWIGVACALAEIILYLFTSRRRDVIAELRHEE